MTIDQKMVAATHEIIQNYGVGHIVTRKDLLCLLHEKYGVAIGSIIPPDYCYNRINDGIILSKPTLFEYLEAGKYRCFGENYPYNGNVYHKDLIVGNCVDGKRMIFGISDLRKQVLSVKKKEQQSRTPSTRLRFEVLVRDKSTCRMCGASPTKDPSVTLHIDHIIPWSKGGKTTLSNLQTLCAACNLGKSDIIIE